MIVQRHGHCYRDVATSKVLDAWFPSDQSNIARSCLAEHAGIIQGECIHVTLDTEQPPRSAEEAYLALHLLSERSCLPHAINLDGLFGLLTNVAWTTQGPILPTDLDRLKAASAQSHTHVSVTSIDKFPRMTDYVIPSGVRIADADRVRLGAHLADGTTVMHEGFVNFNAGTLGASMVEGRISAGVVIGAHSDIGGGASIMGTLSGGGQQVIRVGEHCLFGANSGLGISLGNHCTIEAGLYLTAGSKVTYQGQHITARALSGKNHLLFRRNSISGAIEAIDNQAQWNGLNDKLHAND